jgi:predicted nucleotidyltransferase
MFEFGLQDDDKQIILDILKAYPQIEEVVLFGSRALNTFKATSDIDLAIKGKDIHSILAVLIADFEESDLIYEVDLVDYAGISTEKLFEHIDRHGKVFYRKGWVETTLGKVINIYSGKTRPKQQGFFPVYGGNGILNYGDNFNQEGETIVIGRVGAYCGNVFYETEKFWLSDNALGIKVTDSSFAKFFYYKLVSMKLNSRAIGAAQPLLTQTLLNELEISLPPLPE